MFKIGLDLGYGYTKGINELGRAVIFPSLVGNAYQRQLKSLFSKDDIDIVNNMHLVLTNSEKTEYFVGELARLESRNVTYAFDEDKINHPNTKVLLAAASLLLFPEDDVPVSIVTGLPLEQYVHQKQDFINMLKNCRIIAGFKSQQGMRTIKFDRVSVFPQAAGAMYGFIMADPARYMIRGSFIGLIDIGFRTTDYIVFKCEDKLILREDLSGTLDLGMSMLNNAADKMFTERSGSKLDIPEVMQLVSDGKIFYRGKYIDLSKELTEEKGELAKNIKDRIKAVWGNKLDYFNVVFLAGGGVRDLIDYMCSLYDNTVLIDDPQLGNARGFLKVAIAEEKRAPENR